jgi:hypothetical protein
MIGACDCCNRQNVPLRHVWAYGIETYACDECCGTEPDDDEEQEAYSGLQHFNSKR